MVSPKIGARRFRLSTTRAPMQTEAPVSYFRWPAAEMAGVQAVSRIQWDPDPGADVGDDLVDETRVDGFGLGVEVQNRVDDGAKKGRGVDDDIGHGPGRGVAICGEFRLHRIALDARGAHHGG
jgi:hypothetical protein